MSNQTNPANQFPPEDFINGFRNQSRGFRHSVGWDVQPHRPDLLAVRLVSVGQLREPPVLASETPFISRFSASAAAAFRWLWVVRGYIRRERPTITRTSSEAGAQSGTKGADSLAQQRLSRV